MMLKLNYIIVGYLPKREKEYLTENLSADAGRPGEFPRIVQIENQPAAAEAHEAVRSAEGQPDRETAEAGKLQRVRSAEEQPAGRTVEVLKRYPAEQSLLVSQSRAELEAAHKLDMAALGFLGGAAQFGGKMSEHTAGSACAGWVGNAPADMYAEGLEEVGHTFLRHVYERHHHLPWTILTTKRCVVKEFSMDYLDDLFALYAGEGMTDYMEPLYPYEQESAYQQAYIGQMYGFYGYGMWIVCEKETGKLIGRAGVEHRGELGGELELGYAIGVPYQRMGYATEVCTAILDYVRTELQRTKILCLIEPGNTVSEHFARRLGFSMEEIVETGGKQMKKYSRSLCY